MWMIGRREVKGLKGSGFNASVVDMIVGMLGRSEVERRCGEGLFHDVDLLVRQ